MTMIEGFKTIKVKEVKMDEIKGWIEESVIDPIHESLSPEIWSTGNVLKRSARAEIEERIAKWLKKMEVNSEITGMYLVGSMATLQYSDTSDIDINVELEDITSQQIRNLIKFLPNGDNLLKTKHPVNYWLSNNDDSLKNKEVVYDILNEKWIRKYNKTDIKIPFSYAVEIAKFFISGARNRIMEYELDTMELNSLLDNEGDSEVDKHIESKKLEIKADLDSIHTALMLCKSFRKEAFSDDYEPDFLINIGTNKPDFSINNIVYKIIEKTGIIDEMVAFDKKREKLKD